MSLVAEHVSWRRGGTLVVDDVSLAPTPGSVVGLLGPNGSGKSSLLRVLQGISHPDAGRVLLDGSDIRHQRRRDLARSVAAVTQHATTEVDLTVRDVVRLGRTPHASLWGSNGARDDAIVDAALAQAGLTAKSDSRWHSLSGGEQQRAQIARALAQETRELLLDEPTNHLDIRHQLELLTLVRSLPVTVVVALHDLNLAAMFCDEVLVMAAGRAVAAGPPAEVLTDGLIEEVYGVKCRVTIDGGRPSIAFTPPA
ncbi:ABC transporter ATP-binding protein [Microbacterium oleivorans]|uniref:ABC transporter ATP-binding protein n=1 Tax=Microbacterium oleivorans TaxID=273677 RepID=UPI000767CE94|nr:ABC transporter ATP-binding protein [Microbacterium oleivorans]